MQFSASIFKIDLKKYPHDNVKYLVRFDTRKIRNKKH